MSNHSYMRIFENEGHTIVFEQKYDGDVRNTYFRVEETYNGKEGKDASRSCQRRERAVRIVRSRKYQRAVADRNQDAGQLTSSASCFAFAVGGTVVVVLEHLEASGGVAAKAVRVASQRG